MADRSDWIGALTRSNPVIRGYGAGWKTGRKQDLLRAVWCIYQDCRSLLNLTKLRRITVTDDLDGAMAAAKKRWERQPDPHSPVFRSRIAVAGCAVEVMHRNRLMGEVFLDAQFLEELIDPNHPESCAATIVAHELAHVALFHWREKPASAYVFPIQHKDWRYDILRYLTLAIWEEYAACRLTARIGHPEPVFIGFMDCLRARLSGGLPKLPRTRRKHWHRQDAVVPFIHAVEHVRAPLLTSAYLMGHLDGLNLPMEVTKLSTPARTSPLLPCWPLLHKALREVWKTPAPFNLTRLDALVPVLEQAVHICGGSALLAKAPG